MKIGVKVARVSTRVTIYRRRQANGLLSRVGHFRLTQTFRLLPDVGQFKVESSTQTLCAVKWLGSTYQKRNHVFSTKILLNFLYCVSFFIIILLYIYFTLKFKKKGTT